MSSSRDDFGIAFRSALLQRGAAQKFSLVFLIIIASIIFFLDVYGFTVVKTTRSFINDVVYRLTYLASAPTRLFPGVSKGIAGHFNLKKENEELRQVIERYKAQDLNLEHLDSMISTITLSDVVSAASDMLSGKTHGRIIVDVNA